MIKIIVAVSLNNVIGVGEQLPWKLRDDMEWFKEKTKHEPVVMGRKTFFSLPEKFRPLPERENIILTKNPHIKIPEGFIILINNFLPIVRRSEEEDIWVIGGSEIYEIALFHAQEIYLTRVHMEIEGDVFFPIWNKDQWELVFSKNHDADERNEFSFTWEIYRRKNE